MSTTISFYVQLFREGVSPGAGERMPAAHMGEVYQKAKAAGRNPDGSAAVRVKRDALTSAVLELDVVATFGLVPGGWAPSDT